MKTAIARLATAAASPELLERIHERLAANEHVILPLADPPLASARWRVAAAAVLVLAAGAGLWVAWPTATLPAGDIRGELPCTPPPRRASATASVTVRAAPTPA